MFLRNFWYVAAYYHEIGRKPLGRTVLGEPVVLFRKEDGTAVALEDRCVHRHLPLSMGRLVGDTLQCHYHGLRYDRTGACVLVPGQDTIPPGARVKVPLGRGNTPSVGYCVGLQDDIDGDVDPKRIKEILEVISNPPTDPRPAFDAIVRRARLFPNAAVVISLPDGDQVKLAAIAGADAGDREKLSARYPLPFVHACKIVQRKFPTSCANGDA